MSSTATRARLVVTIPETPDAVLSPNARVHWRKHHRVFQLAKQAAYFEAIQATNVDASLLRVPENAPLAVRAVVAWERYRKKMDETNLRAALKAFEDGVALAIGIDDRHFRWAEVRQERDPDGAGYTIIELTEAGEDG